MKNLILALSLTLVIGTTVSLNSCKKVTKTSASDDSQSAQDNSAVSNGVNASTDDATNAAGQVQSFSGKTDSHWWNSAVLCGTTTVDSGTAGNHTITITYDGTTTCNGVIRTGNITVVNNTGIAWKNAGAVLTVTFNSLVIKDVVSGYSYTVNGTHTITNETGGLAWQVLAGLSTTTVTHRNQSSNMAILFPDGSTRNWNVDRTRSWSASGSTITVTVSSENAGNVDSWGTNRNGVSFTNTIVSPIVANNNQSCPWKPYAGKTTHALANTANRTVTVQYGTDASGTPDGTATTCPEGFFITFSKDNHTATRFVRYW